VIAVAPPSTPAWGRPTPWRLRAEAPAFNDGIQAG